MFYAVWNGKEGNMIYDNWEDCKANTNGVSGVRFKKFTYKELAVRFIDDCQRDFESKKCYTSGELSYSAAFVDGSINPSTSVPGWAAILFEKEENVLHSCPCQ